MSVELNKASRGVDAAPIVNVAMVPQRSLFRYPGGKTWLIPYIRQWLKSLPSPVVELIEPFAGGAIVGLTAAFEGLAEKVTLVERDPDVAAVWEAIIENGQGPWLADRITGFEMTLENVRAVLDRPAKAVRERAFQTILRNRVQRGGIMAAGAGLMKLGENGRGLASRWYPETLRKRMLAIHQIRKRITFCPGDGMEVIERNLYRQNVAFFIDPPYTVAGRRLYTFSEIDHERLFRMASKSCGDFLITYDDAAETRLLAERFGFETRLIAMKNTHHTKLVELLIGRKLAWVLQRHTAQSLSFQFSLEIA